MVHEVPISYLRSLHFMLMLHLHSLLFHLALVFQTFSEPF